MRSKVIRKAILIGAPGGQGSVYLPGVKKDLRDVCNYLCSIRGGLWREDEVLILHNPSAEQALFIIQSTQADYLLVYFSGHGYTDFATGSRMLCFKNRSSVSDITLTQAISPRLLLVNDTCRKYHGESIGSILAPDPDYFDISSDRNQIRQLFDEAILNSPHGKIIVHGTAENQLAMDSKEGGYFTQALLHVAERMTISFGHQLVTIEQVLHYVPEVLEKRGNEQVPEIYYLCGELAVPFGVALPEADNLPVIISAQSMETDTSSDEGGRLLLGLGVLALVLCLAD
jgi:hypothetical protein